MSKCSLSAIGVGMALAAGALFGQAPAFEVASIKPSEPVTPAMVAAGKIHAGMKIDAARVDIGMLSLMDLVCKAYDVKSYQVSGPSWLSAQRFDIMAKLPEGGTKEQVPQMLQALLAERFKLTIHRDKKERPVFALVVGKGGLKMKESEPDPAAPEGAPASTGSSQVTLTTSARGSVVSDGQGGQTKMSMGADGKSMRMETSKMSMAQLSEALSRFVDRPVVDMTELKGNFQVALEISMAEMMGAARTAGMAVPNGPAAGGADSSRPAEAAADPSGGTILTSVQALGLKLEPRKAPLDLIVIDRAEKMPTEN
jgi:uncharacterized protein (TIGR03435 family)